VRLTFVTPRYQATGGAEAAAAQFAKRLAARNHSVTILTSNATSMDWVPDLDATTFIDDGVTIKRLAVQKSRSPNFHSRWGMKMKFPSVVDFDQYLSDQGPTLAGFLEELEATDPDRIIIYPYPYLPGVQAATFAPEKAVLHPAAHPEPMLRIPGYRQVFEQAGRLVFQTRAESDLVNQLFRIASAKQLILPLGVEPFDTSSKQPDPSDPFCLVLGRIQRDKGSLLIQALSESDLGLPTIVMAGPLVERLASTDKLKVLGEVTSEERNRLLSTSQFVCILSRYEAFSLVAVEAMAAGKPILVNANNPVLKEQVELSGGGIAVKSADQLVAAMSLLASNEPIRRKLGSAGKTYAGTVLKWPRIISLYEEFLAT
jgi:glycosyltransferase involved in cell wall biosynthesis